MALSRASKQAVSHGDDGGETAAVEQRPACGGWFQLGRWTKKTIVACYKPMKRKHRSPMQVVNSVAVHDLCSAHIVDAIKHANQGSTLEELGHGSEVAKAVFQAAQETSALQLAEKRVTVEELFESRQLHVRVIAAKRLISAKLDNTSDPFINVTVGEEMHSTSVVKKRLDPAFSESFTFSAESCKQGNYIIELEAWSFDDWHPDDFLGQAEIDLRQLPLQPNVRPVSAIAKLYVLKRNGKKEPGDFGEVQVAVWTSPQDAKEQFLSPGFWGTVPNVTPEIMSLCAARKQLPSVHTNALGTLYEEPCIAYIKVSIVGIMGLTEGVSTAPAVCPNTGRLLHSLSGLPSGRSEAPNSSEAVCKANVKALGHGGVQAMARNIKQKVERLLPLVKFQKFQRQDGSQSDKSEDYGEGEGASDAPPSRFHHSVLATIRPQNRHMHRHHAKPGSSLPAPSKTFPDKWDLEGLQRHCHGDSYDEQAEDDAQDAQDLAATELEGGGNPDASCHEPAQPYIYFKLTYAKQTFHSHLKRLNAKGDSLHDESFVFATVRPLAPRPLEINVYLALNTKRKGKLISRTSYEITDMIRACNEAPRSAPRGEPTHDLLRNLKWADEYALPVLRWPLEHLTGLLRMHVGLADADYRAEMYHVPLVDPDALRPSVSNLSLADSKQVTSASFADLPSANPSGRDVSAANGSVAAAAVSSAAEGPHIRHNSSSNSLLGVGSDCAGLAGGVPPHAAHDGRNASPPDVVDGCASGPGDGGESRAAAAGCPRSAAADARSTVPGASGAVLAKLAGGACGGCSEVGCGSAAGATDDAEVASARHGARGVSGSSLAGLGDIQGEEVAGGAGSDRTSRDGSGEEGAQAGGHEHGKGGSGLPSPTILTSAAAIRQTVCHGLGSKSFSSTGANDVDAAGMCKRVHNQHSLHASAASTAAFNLPWQLSAMAGHAQAAVKQAAAWARQVLPQSNAYEPQQLKPSPKPKQLMPIGTLFITIEQIEMSLPNVAHFGLLKCGPHWCKTLTRHSGKEAGGTADMRHFEMRLPIYDPSEAVTAVTFIFRALPLTRKGKLDVYPFSRSIIPLSAVPPDTEVSRVIVNTRMYKEDGTEHKWEEGQSGYATQTVRLRLKVKCTGGRLSIKCGREREATMPFKVQYSDYMWLAKTYILRPPHPPAWYVLGLDETGQHQLDKQYRKIVSRWLERCSTPLPASCVKVVLAKERDSFQMDILLGNWRRLVRALHWVMLLQDGITHIQTWDNVYHSIMAYCLVMCICFVTTPTVSVLLGAAFLSSWGQRHRAHNATSIPAVEEDEEDSDVVIPTANPYAELRRKYEDVVGLALMVQNYLDDAACFVERLQSMHNWQDPVSTACFVTALGATTVIVYLLGLPMVMCLGMMYALRPPALRDPEPTPIENYFGRLPTLQAITRAARLKQASGVPSASGTAAANSAVHKH